ncbi:MAG: AraC family transcriptional regulator [Oscillospiraceae bacterium]|nr:AraC family transcriptional regulator [Oscillospiraceae bacterium]
MNNNNIRIEQFKNISYVKDKKGRILTFHSRYASCFIITLKGRLKFTFDDKIIITDHTQGLFIPEGMAYINECLEDAASISVNFQIAEPATSPRILNGMSEVLAMDFYQEICRKAYENTEIAQYYLLSKLYQLALLLFQNDSPKSIKEILAKKACSYIQSEFSRSDLQIDDVARFCNISAVYLRKIMKEIYHKTPFELLTELRMKKAYEMLMEKMSVKEIALTVGYSDIYQFSRAFKRHFGHTPTTVSK